MRYQWSDIKLELEELEDVSIDLFEIVSLSEKFFNLCIRKKQTSTKFIQKLLIAKTYLETCLTLIKSIVEPNENIFIEHTNEKMQSYDILEKYFENFMAILDGEQKTTIDTLKNVSMFNKSVPDIHLNSYKEKLVDHMNNLVLYPLLNAYKNYSDYMFNKNLPTEVSKKDIFIYMLFREVYIASKIKGSALRQKIAVASQTVGSSTFHETNITRSPSKRNYDFNPNINKVPPESPEDFFKDLDIFDGDRDENTDIEPIQEA